jgi:hypothetical protein
MVLMDTFALSGRELNGPPYLSWAEELAIQRVSQRALVRFATNVICEESVMAWT